MILRAPGAPEVSQTRHMPACRPIVFVFDDLLPNLQYRLHTVSEGAGSGALGRVKTPATEPISVRGARNVTSQRHLPARIVVLSCNNIYDVWKRGGKKDPWAKLAGEVLAGTVDVVLHIGDQVYMDNQMERVTLGEMSPEELLKKLEKQGEDSVFLRACIILDKLPQSDWPKFKDEIVEMYRVIYRQTWSHPATAQVLANTSNIMILDDHEIRDNWGTNVEDYDENTHEYFSAMCAYTAYKEYQAQLIEDIDFTQDLRNHVDHLVIPDLFFSPHNIGLLGFDYRGKTFRQRKYPYEDPMEPQPLLGTVQWNRIRESLREGGDFEHTHTLVVATPVPLVWAGVGLTKAIEKKAPDVLGMMTHPINVKELGDVFQVLSEWRARKVYREVVLVAGDVHVGAITTIRQNGTDAFTQLVSSSMSQHVFTGVEEVVGTGLLRRKCDLPGGYYFLHKQILFRNNFGRVVVGDSGFQVTLHTNQRRAFLTKLLGSCQRHREQPHVDPLWKWTYDEESRVDGSGPSTNPAKKMNRYG